MAHHSPFAHIDLAPADPILGLTEQFRADAHPQKLNLAVGIYQDESGINPILECVKRAEKMRWELERSKSYLPIAGTAGYLDQAQRLLFGAEHSLLAEKRVVSLHTPGGTGALRLGAEFLHAYFPQATLWLSEPTWPNHPGVFSAAGMRTKPYPYHDREHHSLREEDLLAALDTLPAQDLVLLHACCHNPTGVDPSPALWQRIIEKLRQRSALAFVDLAYQGFGAGLEQDTVLLEELLRAGVPFLVASSFSKNMGLYRERTGMLSMVCADADEATRVFSQLKRLARSLYSNPPAHGGYIVEYVLREPELRALWQEELTTMRKRMQQIRVRFAETLIAVGLPQLAFIGKERGMFSISGLSPHMVQELRQEHGIYLTNSGRINISAITFGNMHRIAQSFHNVCASSSIA